MIGIRTASSNACGKYFIAVEESFETNRKYLNSSSCVPLDLATFELEKPSSSENCISRGDNAPCHVAEIDVTEASVNVVERWMVEKLERTRYES
jgi:hypothetical protein